jgi:hypothetical protein
MTGYAIGDHGDDDSEYTGPYLSFEHKAMLEVSGISLDHAEARGYETITDAQRLADLGIVKAARICVPGLLIPLLDKRGQIRGHQYRPDHPRRNGDGKAIKYETPWGQRNMLDIPPGVSDSLDDPTVPLWVTEGTKKADCGAQHGLCIIALSGVWNWRGTNDMGGKTAIGDWNDIALNGRLVVLAFDGDVARKPNAAKALCALADFLKYRRAQVKYLHLPDTDHKTGLDDYLVAGHTTNDLWRLVKPHQPPIPQERPEPPPTPPPPPAEPITLAAAHAVFTRWLGAHYDTDVLDAVLASAAVGRFTDGSDRSGCLWSAGQGSPRPRRCRHSMVPGPSSPAPSPPKVRCCRHRLGTNVPAMPPEGCCARSVIVACSSSRT